MDQAVFQSPKPAPHSPYPSTPVALFGRCMLPNQLEIPCQAIEMSPEQAMLVSAHAPNIGDRAIIYLDNVGRIEGNISGHFSGGFAMEIDCTPRKRDKLAGLIKQHRAQDDFGHDNQRAHQRIAPKNTNSELKLADGRAYPIKIIDISLSGAAISIDVKPAIGSKVWLAGMEGTVVRHFQEGIGMQFAVVSDQSTVTRRFG
ncbi:MAG: PilZ domain-containing protein [Hyphomicrobiales bacterium]|nr:PilZ domain-containing protein [Hyphomicrobiales bacterium]